MTNARSGLVACSTALLLAACSGGSADGPAPRPGASPQQPSSPRPLPNFLFLISDDHSVPDLGAYGNTAVHSPNLDRLAAQGIRFDKAFVASPQCSPSRSSIVTGQMPQATGTSRLHAPLRDVPTALDALASAGYFLGAYRKVHLGDQVEAKWDFRGDDEEPFTSFFDRLPADRPFFLHIGFDDPHRPYEDGAFDPPHDPAKVVVPHFLPDTPEVRADLARYYDEIARMDAEVGGLLALLEERGLADDTLILFAGDNGLPFPGAKGSLYEPGVRVPLLAAWAGKIAPGSVDGHLVSLLDLPATWLDAAGLPRPEGVRGRSFLRRLTDPDAPPTREAVFMERDWHDNLDLLRGVRNERYKLIQNYLPERPYEPTLDLEESPSWQSILALHEAGRLPPALAERFTRPRRPAVELYDLEKDPHETRNLADSPEHAEALQTLKHLLTESMKRDNDFLPPPLGEYPASHH